LNKLIILCLYAAHYFYTRKGTDYKDIAVNSPLISFTLHDPEGATFSLDNLNIHLVFKHTIAAKYPTAKTIHRDLMKGEERSAVIGSSICSYLFLNSTNNQLDNDSKTNATFWTWDDEGCHVESTNRTHTVCRCNHLTGFSNLMNFHNYTVSFSCKYIYM